MPSYQYRKSHCGDKTVVRSSYLYNGISYTGKITVLSYFKSGPSAHKVTLEDIGKSGWYQTIAYPWKPCAYFISISINCIGVAHTVPGHLQQIMTSRYGNAFHIIGPLWGNFNDRWWTLLMRCPATELGMWGKTKVPTARLWLHGLYGLHGPRCLTTELRCFIWCPSTSCWTNNWGIVDFGQHDAHVSLQCIILVMGSANERRRYFVTSSLTGWAHTQIDCSGDAGWLIYLRNTTG